MDALAFVIAVARSQTTIAQVLLGFFVFSMSDDIPYAQPFPWTEESQGNVTRSLRKRKFVGSGLARLRKESLGVESKMGNVAKNILMNLFHQHGIELDGEMESDGSKFKGIGLSERVVRLSSHSSETEIEKSSQNNIVDQSKLGENSIFIGLLDAITKSSTGRVSTRLILSKVCLLLQPGSLPGIMDAKDIVLAALHFLSSHDETKSDQILRLPLIRPLQPYGDLEKRNFEKVGDWKLENIKGKLLRMEEVFLSSPSSWKWQKRESLSVRLSQSDEESFFMKGTVPLCATTKKLREKRKSLVKTTKSDLSRGGGGGAAGKEPVGVWGGAIASMMDAKSGSQDREENRKT